MTSLLDVLSGATWRCVDLHAPGVPTFALAPEVEYGGLFSDLDRRLIVAAQDGSHKIDCAVLNKPHGDLNDA